jgi:hypothetical protein
VIALPQFRPAFAGSGLDSDALAYIAAVEAADGQLLEPATRLAINAFVKGCKNDGIWNAIKASCILAGARTLSGALVPLRGTAPTNNNFVSLDYNRKTGLIGNGTTKYLNANRNNNADPQNSKHLAVWRNSVTQQGAIIGTNTIGDGASWIFDGVTADTIRLNTSPSIVLSATAFPSIGFIGASRSNSSQIDYRFSGTTTTASSTSQLPLDTEINVFRGVGNQYVNLRMTFYSIGESVDLTSLNSRVSTLMTDLTAAIP